jgi:sialate O-acetylesterase
VRYAWAHNPVANVEDRNSLPLTPFRTDNWKLTTE